MTIAAGKTPYHSYEPGSAMSAEAIPFEFLDAGDLVVRVVGGDVLTEGTHYTIGGDGRTGTGAITAQVEVDAGVAWELFSNTPDQQQLALAESRKVPLPQYERELDRQAIRNREARRDIARSLKVPQGEALGGVPRLADRKGKFLLFDPVSGDPLASHGTGADAGLREDMADPAVGGRLLSLGGNKSAADIINAEPFTIYARQAGSDVTGTGTAEAPFGTPTAALQRAALLGLRQVKIDLGDRDENEYSVHPAGPLTSEQMQRTSVFYLAGILSLNRTDAHASGPRGGVVIQGGTLRNTGGYDHVLYQTAGIGSVIYNEMRFRGAMSAIHRPGNYGHIVRCDFVADTASIGLSLESMAMAELVGCTFSGYTFADVYVGKACFCQIADTGAGEATLAKVVSLGWTDFAGAVTVTELVRGAGGMITWSGSSFANSPTFDCAMELTACQVQGTYGKYIGTPGGGKAFTAIACQTDLNAFRFSKDSRLDFLGGTATLRGACKSWLDPDTQSTFVRPIREYFDAFVRYESSTEIRNSAGKLVWVDRIVPVVNVSADGQTIPLAAYNTLQVVRLNNTKGSTANNCVLPAAITGLMTGTLPKNGQIVLLEHLGINGVTIIHGTTAAGLDGAFITLGAGPNMVKQAMFVWLDDYNGWVLASLGQRTRETGWGAITGVAAKKTAFAAPAALPVSNPPTQAEMQAVAAVAMEAIQRIKAHEDRLIARQEIAA